MNEEIKKSNVKLKFKPYIKQCCLIGWSVEKIKSKNPKVIRTKNGRVMHFLKCAMRNSKI